MPDLIGLLGIHLQLLIGRPTVLVPAPYDVVDALVELEVSNNDRERDGFQMTFNLGRKGATRDYALLQGGLLDPPNRVSISVFIQGLPQVLINGIITKHQFLPSHAPGQSQLRVTGEDTGVELDLTKKKTTYRNMSDSSIVETVLKNYPDLRAIATPTTEVPSDSIPQYDTDLAFIQKLAKRNSFVFYTEPVTAPGFSIAYWGPRDRLGQPPQPALMMNMGSDTNVEQLSFGFNALEPVTSRVTITDPLTKLALPIPTPSSLDAPLAGRPTTPLRTIPLSDTANLNPIQAGLRGLMATSESADAVVGNGIVDVVSYGRALRSRQQVCVRGVGETHDGLYRVTQVTHHIKQGEYKQSCTLAREGRGATSPVCLP